MRGMQMLLEEFRSESMLPVAAQRGHSQEDVARRWRVCRSYRVTIRTRGQKRKRQPRNRRSDIWEEWDALGKVVRARLSGACPVFSALSSRFGPQFHRKIRP